MTSGWCYLQKWPASAGPALIARDPVFHSSQKAGALASVLGHPQLHTVTLCRKKGNRGHSHSSWWFSGAQAALWEKRLLWERQNAQVPKVTFECPTSKMILIKYVVDTLLYGHIMGGDLTEK